ncbi:MAG: DUF4192 domain-containing protein [Propionicimonas sp.]|uniref:DUF4192 domain-containing protein n=1 Tax=Propionicimonas sp. TaxID=1955623 RepID=UPI003D0A4923
MSVSEHPARLAVHSVDDLVGLVPYLLGFHPEESLVVLVLDHGRVAVTARVDLPAAEHTRALDGMLARLFGRFPGAEGWFLAFTDDDDLAWDVLAACAEAVGLARLGRIIQVGSRSWRADRPDGASGVCGSAVSTAAVEATLLGLQVRRARGDLAAAIAGPPEAEVEALRAERDARAREVEELGVRGRRRLLRRLLRAPGHLGVADCLRLALLVRRAEAQLAALRGLCRANAEQQLELWTRVVRRCLAEDRPTVLGLLAMAAWQTGDGALQVVCLEEIDRLDPDLAMAVLLEYINAEVVPPYEWDGLRESALALLAAELRGVDPPGSRRGR